MAFQCILYDALRLIRSALMVVLPGRHNTQSRFFTGDYLALGVANPPPVAARVSRNHPAAYLRPKMGKYSSKAVRHLSDVEGGFRTGPQFLVRVVRVVRRDRPDLVRDLRFINVQAIGRMII